MRIIIGMALIAWTISPGFQQGGKPKPGIYVKDERCFKELNRDGSFYAKDEGGETRGKYTWKESTITFIPKKGRASIAHYSPDALVDSASDRWTLWAGGESRAAYEDHLKERQRNRDQVCTRLINFGAQAQQYFRRPSAPGGTENSFVGFQISVSDTGDSVGSYSVSAALPTGSYPTPGDSVSYTGATDGPVYIIGVGKKVGSETMNPVKVYAEVSVEKVITKILN